TDGGKSWANSNLIDGLLLSLAVLDNGDVLAGGAGLHVSKDQGKTFASVGSPQAFVNSIAADSQTIYLGTSFGVMKSTDHGNTWTTLLPHPQATTDCGCQVD